MEKIFVFLSFLITGIAQSQTDGYAISSDATQIHYRIYGTGKPLLIINGGPGMNSNGFETLAEKLSENNMAIIYDQRGTGKSTLATLDGKTITMQLMLDDIEAIRKKLEIEKWSVFGQSFGGMLASFYTTVYPENIDKMVLSASGGIDLGLTKYTSQSIQSKLTQIERDSLAYWNSKIENGDTSHTALLGRGRNLAPAYLYNKKFIPILAERLTQGNGIINGLIWDDLDKIHFDCAKKLKSFKQPVLIIQGNEDIIKPETAEIAHKALTNSKIVFMEHCGHYGWLDAEQVYFTEIEAFLKN